jgi:PAS domain S-box-containing protein
MENLFYIDLSKSGIILFYIILAIMNGGILFFLSLSKNGLNYKPTGVGLNVIPDDTIEESLTEQKTEFERNNLSSLINNTNDLIWSLDKDLKIITSNKAFDDIVKLMSGQSVKRGDRILSTGFSGEQLERWDKFYERAFSGETFTIIEYSNTPIEIWSEISFYPIRKGNEIIGTACYSRNITEIKKAEAEIKKLNEELEERVKRRTSELAKTNILLENETQMVLKTSKIIEQKNKAITDSLNYAKLIQNAIIHKKETLEKFLPQSFILDMPFDIVSGDFVRVEEKRGKILVALADCTGHGIPGAMMSMIGCALFNDIVNYKQKTYPPVVLELLDSSLKELTKEAEAINDGMDVGFCSIDLNSMELNYTGAHRPLYIIRDNVLIEIKGDNLFIGRYMDNEKKFTNHNLKIYKNDTIYMFSDGYVDQFGGKNEKKFSTKRFKEMLVSIQYLSMEEQGDYLKRAIIEWKGELAQVDDICVLGIRI